MKKNFFKNNNISQFSTVSYLSTDENQKLSELQEEKQNLQYDLDLIGSAVKAASKLSNEETPSTEENECLSELKDNYPVFFDSESEEEEATSLLNKIMGVKRYISKELNTNKKSISSLKGKGKMSEFAVTFKESGIEKKDTTIEKKDSKELIIEKGESSKRKADDISDKESIASSSKKIHKSNTDTTEDIFYNPFDDLGVD